MVPPAPVMEHRRHVDKKADTLPCKRGIARGFGRPPHEIPLPPGSQSARAVATSPVSKAGHDQNERFPARHCCALQGHQRRRFNCGRAGAARE